MKMKIVPIEKIHFPLRLGKEARAMLELVKKIDGKVTHGVELTPEKGEKMEELQNRVNGRLQYWRKQGWINKQIAMSVTEDGKLSVYYRLRRKDMIQPVGNGLAA